MRWGHEGGGNNCTLAEFKRWAKDQLSDSSQTAVFHAAPYDLRAFSNIGVKIGAIPEDTGVLSALLYEHEPNFSLGGLGQKYLGRAKSDQRINELAAARFGGAATRKAQAGNYWRLPGDEVEEYAEDDADLTIQLYDLRYPELINQGLLRVYQTETMVIPVLHRMWMAGVRIDVEKALEIQRQMKKEFAQVEKDWNYHSGGIRFSERKRLINFLLDLGIELPYSKGGKKKSEKEGHTKEMEDWSFFSVDKAALAAIEHPVGGMIKRMRQLSHYSETFIQSYLLDNVDEFGFIFPNFHQVKRNWGNDEEDQTGTITGRFSSSGGLNAQNIPARDDVLAPLIRSMFIPMNEDSIWLKGDYNSIEYRFFAHYAGGNLRQSYINNPKQDLHQWVADICGIKRSHAKNVNFAKLYGAGIPKLAKTIGISEDEVREIMKIYDERVPEARRLYNKAMNRGSARGYITTWGGRKLRFESVGNTRKKYLGTFKALNKVCQGSSADLIKEAMIAVDQAIDWDTTKLHLTVHDELDLSIPRGDAGKKVMGRIKDAMETFDVTVPILAEFKVGENWGHGKDPEEFFK
jgi:DNA polymerase-1